MIFSYGIGNIATINSIFCASIDGGVDACVGTNSANIVGRLKVHQNNLYIYLINT